MGARGPRDSPLRVAFITSTPLNVREGSGTFVAIKTLADALKTMGVQIDLVAPKKHLPVKTAERLLFNAGLRFRRWDPYDVTVGFDLDGYRIAGRTGRPHLASIKGVIADEMQYERGLARATMSLQARREAHNVRHADRIVTTSHYSAGRLMHFYGLEQRPAVIPELIDLARWREVFRLEGGVPDAGRFVVLCVCRLYRRKRVDLLLRAVAELKPRIPQLHVRIAGEGPESKGLERLRQSLGLGEDVTWLGTLDRQALAREYNRCNVFCLPSVQEGFGIVFLEAMAAARPIVAARAAAVPEVVPHALLVEPDSHQALAAGIESLYRQPDARGAIAAAGVAGVQQFDAPRVARQFLAELEHLVVPAESARLYNSS
ncbi:MAG: glycosyltransferase family 4 protein [Acidobacteriia bacterium]|nr:glycosyltransferase family 4 protein [Terriglobia bacterium]